MLSKLAAPQRNTAIGRTYLRAEPRDLPRGGRRIADVRRHSRQLYHLRSPGADVESRARAVPAKMRSDGDGTSASSRCATRQSRSKRTAKLPRHLSSAARRVRPSASSGRRAYATTRRATRQLRCFVRHMALLAVYSPCSSRVLAG